jgi:hypothetical protein
MEEPKSWWILLGAALAGLALHSSPVLEALVEAVRSRWQPRELDPNDNRPIELQ